jgi:hypothetical protein
MIPNPHGFSAFAMKSSGEKREFSFAVRRFIDTVFVREFGAIPAA